MPRSNPSRKVVRLPVPRRRAPTNPVLGHCDDGDLELDLDCLMRTRLLVTAASGGGKSYALRRILEQTHQKVQQIVIDPEGELVTLAQKFDYLVLSADSEETPLRCATAGQLAQKLWKSGHSVILCLDAMEVEDMQGFVANFLRGLMATRKQDWHPLILAIDEAQLWAPQQDRSEAKKPMVDVAARGRKRGICPVVATQRLSMLHKGVVAQLQNHMIGLTTLDNDVERAAELLGIKQAKAAETLRDLESGEFLVYGPALGYDVRAVKVGPVQTQHGILGKFATGRRRRPMAKTKILNLVRELGTAPPAAGDAAAPAGEQDTRQKLAEFRRWVIAPLLADDAARGAIAQRCRQLDLTQMEVGTWRTLFKKRFQVADLQPVRVRQSMVDDVVRLSTLMLQDTAHHRSQKPAAAARPLRRAA